MSIHNNCAKSAAALLTMVLSSCGANSQTDLLFYDKSFYADVVPTTSVTQLLKRGISDEAPRFREMHNSLSYQTSIHHGKLTFTSLALSDMGSMEFSYRYDIQVAKLGEKLGTGRSRSGILGAYDQADKTMDFSAKNMLFFSADYEPATSSLYVENFTDLIRGLRDDSAEYDDTSGTHYRIGEVAGSHQLVKLYRYTGNDEGLIFTEAEVMFTISPTTGRPQLASSLMSAKYKYGEMTFHWSRQYYLYYANPLPHIGTDFYDGDDSGYINGYSVGKTGFDITPSYELSERFNAVNAYFGTGKRLTKELALATYCDGSSVYDHNGDEIFTSSLEKGVIGRYGTQPLTVKAFLDLI